MNDHHRPLGGTPGPSLQPGQPVTPPYGAPYGQSPPAPPSTAEIRPRKRWIFFGWLFFAATLGLGVAVFVSGISSTIDGLTLGKTFASGGSASLEVEPEQLPVIWISPPQEDARCWATDTGDPSRRAELNGVRGTQTLEVNQRTWRAVFEISVPAAGTYEVTCGAAGDAVFAVGPSLADSAQEAVSAVASLIVIPLVGFIVAVSVTVVVLVRRTGARKRLAAGGRPHA